MKRLFLILFCMMTPFSLNTCFAAMGVSGTVLLIAKNPDDLKGGRFSIWYQPRSLIWTHARVFFDASVGHWWVPSDQPNSSITIFAIAPVFRYYFIYTSWFSPFMDLSIGPSYLSKTKIEKRNLGIHFAFQDQFALGATIGREQRLSVSLGAMHYSDGGFSEYNAGITIPLFLDISYRITT